VTASSSGSSSAIIVPVASKVRTLVTTETSDWVLTSRNSVVSALTRDIARRAGRLQTGYVYHYAFAMLIGVVLLISWYLVVRAH